MKDEQRVYIKGDSERGKEVIKILEDLGGINNLCYTGMNKDAVYFINPQGEIDWTSNSNTSTILSFLKEFYKEVKLPKWKPKNEGCYYFIDDRGTIITGMWNKYGERKDNLRYQFGNCFRTKEEAEAVRDKIKNVLNNK